MWNQDAKTLTLFAVKDVEGTVEIQFSFTLEVSPPEKCQPTNTLAKYDLVSFLTLLSFIIHHKILVYKTHTVLETLLYLVFKTSSGDIHASIFRIAMAV